MKKLFSISAISLLAIFLLSSCSKDATTLLTDGTWNFSNMTTDSDDPDIIALITLGKAVFTDGTLEFNADETFIMDAPLLEEPMTGTWSLIGDDQLVMDIDDQLPSTANIDVLSKSELKYIETYVDQEMKSYNVTTSWTR